MNSFTLGALFGIGIGMAMMALFTYVFVRYDLRPQLDNAKKYLPALIAALAVLVLFGGGLGAVRADTPVPLTIPTNTIFTSANDWITTFAPIAAIGIGISIALAVLGYLGKMIVSAFRT